jgi:hypothetical protein
MWHTIATSAIPLNGGDTAGFGVPSFVPKWRATADEDGQYSFAVAL